LALQTFKDKLDVLFVPAHTLPVIRRPGLKTVVTVHDLGSEYLPQMHQLKQRIYLRFMQKFQLKSATKIIAVSKATKQDLVERVGIDPNKIEVIYEGYDKDLFKTTKADAFANSLKPYYLFVGTIQPRKNLERLIKAFSKMNNNSLVIVGQAGWMSEKIYHLPKELGIEDMVKFLGYVPDDKLPALYSGAIALVFPSLFEGFGLPILEAQTCGCPVITSNISSMPEVAGKGAILVNPYSVDDIVKGMERVKREGEREKLIKAGFENIKRFSWEKCAEETLVEIDGNK
jgi:glycosyltransferase involved in cell wall biosynthesis